VDENDPRPTEESLADEARAGDAATTDEPTTAADEAAPDAATTDEPVTDEPVTDEPATDESAGEVVPAATGFAGRHPVLVYTLLRLGILVAVAGVLYLLGARGLILLVFAFLVSGLISMVALKRPREGAAYGITTTVRKVNDRIDAAARAEDDDDIDELMGEVTPDRQSPTPPPTS
jgi:hypothetical protein